MGTAWQNLDDGGGAGLSPPLREGEGRKGGEVLGRGNAGGSPAPPEGSAFEEGGGEEAEEGDQGDGGAPPAH